METHSGEVMQKASTALVAGVETQGMIAIGLGLLRGALHEIGGIIINAVTVVLGKASVDLGKDALLEALKEMSVYQPMFLFIQTHVVALLHLASQLPNYFGWLRRLIDVLSL